MPIAHATLRKGARRWSSDVPHSLATTTPRPRANIPAPSRRYGTCVWAQNVAATTRGMSMRWSPQSTAHAASSTTTQAIRGRYGFHGWVRGTCP